MPNQLSNVATVSDYKEILKSGVFKDKHGRTISVRTHGEQPAYLHLTGEPYLFSNLLDRCLEYLKKQNIWVSESVLFQQAAAKKYPIEVVNSTISRLKNMPHVGYLKRQFFYYPPAADNDFQQAAIDNF